MRYRQLGATGPRVSALGLGCMGMSQSYGREKESGVDAAELAEIERECGPGAFSGERYQPADMAFVAR